MENGNRTQSVDIAKGILIILVVVAHAQADIVHDIIFIFHMPLFFVISGFLIRQEKLLKTGYVRGKIKHLIIPYMIYLMLDMLLVRKTLSVRLDVCSLGRSSSNGGLLVHNLFPLYAVFAFYFIKEIFR